jgi:hypothetical protein
MVVVMVVVMVMVMVAIVTVVPGTRIIHGIQHA